MKISIEGLSLIKKFEGLELEAYKCAAGVWTIGYGHIKDVKEGDKISNPQAD
jgi:lysozyme